jgi:Transglycosylase SLT domain
MVASQAGVLAELTGGLTVSSQALDLFYQVPPFLLPIYQAAATQYGVPWEVLAAINEVETDYGNDLSVSTAGAVGWMQFMPETWLQYGVDALNAGYADPYNPVDAIFAAARYLASAGAANNLRNAIYAYNHSQEYVESVLLRARLLASYPPSVIATLTGLTEGAPPLAGATVVQSSVDPSAFPAGGATSPAPAASAPSPAQAGQTAGGGSSVAQASSASRGGSGDGHGSRTIPLPSPQQFVELEAAPTAPVVAAQDGRVVALGHTSTLGDYLALEDIYGDVFTYADLGSVATRYRLPSESAGNAPTTAAAASQTAGAPTPTQAASGGSQLPQTLHVNGPTPPAPSVSASALAEESSGTVAGTSGKVLMFARPNNPEARAAAARFGAHAAQPSYPKGWAPLRVGSVVSQGVTLGSSNVPTEGHAGYVRFAIRPAGDSSAVDPRPILENWEQLQRALHPKGAKGSSGLIGATADDVFLLSKSELEHAVLSDPDIELPACADHEVAAGRIDSRVLALLLFLSRNDLKPSVSAIRCPAEGAVAPNAQTAVQQGEGVDISKINGVPIAEHQGAGSITDLTIRTMLTLQGRYAPENIVSLMHYSGSPTTHAELDHASYIGVGFAPLHRTASSQASAGEPAAHSAGPGATAPSPFAVSLGLSSSSSAGSAGLSSSQWNALLARIGAMPAPTVALAPTSSAIPDTQTASKR